MPLQKYLDNTLHSPTPCKLFVTQCTLAKINKWHEEDKKRKGDKRLGGRPEWLPPPTEVGLRYCKHKDKEGREVAVGEMGEERCILDLVSGGAVGRGATAGEQGVMTMKNKQHFVVATADRVDEGDQKKQQGKSPKRYEGGSRVELRERIRQIPGVPIVYVKRSVMILEELSAASEAVRRQGEREKIKEGLGLGNDRKRKRGEEDGGEDGQENEMIRELMREDGEQAHAARGMARAKGPNPLSVKKKKKVKVDDAPAVGEDEDGKKKTSRRIRGKKKRPTDAGEAVATAATEASD